MTVLFTVVGVTLSLIYYFARYYVKTDHHDNELLTKKPVELDIDKGATVKPDASKSEIQEKRPAPPKNLKQALTKSRDSIWGRLSQLNFSGGLPADIRNEVEEILYTSDLGPQTAEILLAKVSENLSREEKKNSAAVATALREEMATIFAQVEKHDDIFSAAKKISKPTVWMVVGINGAGKTTTIGKLASLAQSQGLSTMIAAGDTFRAAADSQLRAWAERAGCEIYSPENVKDPSAVAYAAVEKAKSKGLDLVIIDTAGRLHTQDHLMAELQKMERVVKKLVPEAPHEKIIVIDANAGQNALAQAREFHKAITLSGVIITKMDGSSKAGIALGIANELHLPINYIGIGESLEDLRRFESQPFIEAII